MNLKIRTEGLELEIQNGDKAQIERTLIGVFAHLNGESFVGAYTALDVEERPVNSKRNFVPSVDGIKVFNGINHYQCAYSCSCGHTGTRFIKDDAAITNCHKCNQGLNVVPSTKDGVHDEEFNYFIAY